jgi:hypothetical protein
LSSSSRANPFSSLKLAFAAFRKSQLLLQLAVIRLGMVNYELP